MERWPEIRLSRETEQPLYAQIAAAIRREIQAGLLPAGVKLPSSRALAKRLAVHRRTVIAAFERLESEGLVSSGVGQGTFVRDRRGDSHRGERTARSGETPGVTHESGYADPRAVDDALAAPFGTGEDPYDGPFPWETMLRRRGGSRPEFWRPWMRPAASGDTIRFMGATADPSLFPAGDFRQVLDEVFRDEGSSALEYGPPEGSMRLRSWVAEMLADRGVTVEPERILIVSGSQQGLDLIARLLLRDGESVLVEEPGYTNGFRLFQAQGARTIGVPVDEGGLRPDRIEAAAGRMRPRFLYLMPHFQNPTGVSLDPARYDALFEVCRRLRLPIVEDQFDADLFYEGEAPVPLMAHDPREQVVLLGSFSKILFPGLRLGWLVAPPALLEPLRELKQLADFSSSLLTQHAMERFCRRGLLDRHLERVRAVYRARLAAMIGAMAAEFPPGVTWTRPKGGLTLWVTLPPEGDAIEVLAAARREGVDFSPGPLFYPNGGGGGHLRLSWIRETEERIARGIAVLGQLLRGSRERAVPGAASGPFI